MIDGARTGGIAATLAVSLLACGGRTAPDLEERSPAAPLPPTAAAAPADAGSPSEPCAVGARRACAVPPPPGTELCRAGTRRCEPAQGGNAWGQCEGYVHCRAVTDTFVYGDALDIVWVVDQSPSMHAEIGRVRDNLDAFGRVMARSGRDYGVVLLATSESPHGLCVQPPLGGPGCSDTEGFHQVDRFVDTGYALVQVQAQIEAIESHLRPGSQRTFIVVSDDESYISASRFDRFLRERGGYAGYGFHAVVGTTDDPCEDVVQAGRVYVELAHRRVGHVVDICARDWSRAYEDLARRILERPRAFELSARPFGEVRVFVGERPLEELPPERWTYDEDRNAVLLRRGSFPEPGARLSVGYRTRAS